MDFKAKLYDRKRPDVAIAEINKVISELLSNNVTINKNVEKIIITAQSLDKNYYDFKELVEAILLSHTIISLIQMYLHLDT